MQLRIFRSVRPSLLGHSLYDRCHFNTFAPAAGGIKSLIPRQPWLPGPFPGHGLAKEKLEACAPPQRQSEELRKLIEAAKVLPEKSRERSPRRKPDEMGRWLCNQCGQMLFQNAFSCRTGHNIPPSKCRKCEGGNSLLYNRTLRGSLKAMLGSAAARARRKGLDFNMSYPDLVGMLEFQRGKCAYSGVGMEIEQPNSHWRMSLERVDNSLGYTTSNCVLIAAEFNSCDASKGRNVDPESVLGSAQWSRHKVEEVRRLQMQPIGLNQLAVDIQHAQHGEPRATMPRTYHAGASRCGQKCGLRVKSLRQHLDQCLSGARRRAKLREQECSITRGILLHLLAKQGGRCFYSGVPLEYKLVHTHWRLSVERLDNSLGYTLENCVLIALEFNTPDYSRNTAVTEVFGTAQWSREKVWHVWGL